MDSDRDTATREIISGPKDVYVINDGDNPLIVEMGSGRNRIFSGKGNDAYSLVLDESLDIIYDKGGENLVAVVLPEGVTFYDVWLELLDDEYVLYCGSDKKTAKKCFQYLFYTDEDRDAKVKLMFREPVTQAKRSSLACCFDQNITRNSGIFHPGH